MEALERKPESRVFYEVLSGSLVWPDELPKAAPMSLDCLRFVLNYRTGLQIGEPRPAFEVFWNEAIRCFPNWIGFSPERMSYNQQLAEFYATERKEEYGLTN